MKTRTRLLLLTFVALALAACAQPTAPPATVTAPAVPTSPPPAAEAAAPGPTAESKPPTATQPAPPTGTPPTVPTDTSAPSAIPALPAEPQEIVFQASDGQELHGLYYPAALNPAPLVVLMHWAPGDQFDWPEMAYWLQNRGLGGNTPNPNNIPWLDPSWFPPMPEGKSYAVFTFTFRGCEGGCQSFEREKWLLDAQAAMQRAAALEGVDPQRIAAIGASIGADGAPDGCLWFNTQDLGACQGALSLSPGGYLTVPYADAVSILGLEEPPKPAWCLYAVGDGESSAACKNVTGDNYRKVEYENSPHGMMLIDTDLEPGALELILEFLGLVLE